MRSNGSSLGSKAFFQKVAASLIIPITFLPLAAVLVAIGVQLHIAPVEAGGLALIRSWLPLFYAIGISIGFTDSDAMGALSVAAGFTVMVSVAEAVSGDPGINLGVLGGVVAGALCTWLYNRVKHVALPEYLALFSGKRMGPIVAALAGVGLGYAFGFLWPPIQAGTLALGRWIYRSGGIGVFVYGSALRLLIPTGLHHILMQLIDNQVGGWVDPSGKLIAGEMLRFLAGDPSAGRILSGFFLTLGFGPAGAALAMTHEARPEQRRKVAGLMTTAALTAALLGVTEPVEFVFIFASPVLLGLHVLLSGLASLVGYLLNIHLGGYALPMILINWHLQQNGWLLLPLGLLWTALYYVSFRLIIRWLRPPILGQVPESQAPTEPEVVSAAVPGEGSAYLEALGGAANVISLDACMTRLRLTLRDPALLKKDRLAALGAVRVLRPGAHDVQVVVGAKAGHLAAQVRAAMEAGSAATQAESPAAGSMSVTLLSPFTGRVIPLEQVPDPVFAGGVAGVGVAVEATDGQLVAPASGTIVHVFPGGHALGLVTLEGLEILIHIGLDTVQLQGEGFHLSVREGDQVQPGTSLGRFDPDLIARQGKSLVSPVLITNADRVEALDQLAGKRATAGEPLFQIRWWP